MKTEKNNMKKNVVWNTIGVFTISLTSFVYSLILVRLCSLSITGIWSYAFALACTSVTLASFGGRTYQVTDANNEIPTYTYISSRHFTVLIALILMIFFVRFKQFNVERAFIILILCSFKFCEEISDVYYGILQKHDCLYIVGKSMFYKSIVNIVLFLVSTLLFQSLLMTVCIIFINNLLFMLFYDQRKAKKLEDIKRIISKKYYVKYFKNNFVICLVLFLAMFLINCPKYAMGSYLSDKNQGIFNIILLPATAVSLLGSFIINPILVSISVDYVNGKLNVIKKKSVKIILVLLLLGFFIVVGGFILGPFLYKLLYGFNLKLYMKEFIIIIIGCTFYTISTVLSMIFITMRILKKQLFYNLILSCFSYLLCVYLVKNYGITGGTYAYSIIMFLRFIIYIIMLIGVRESGVQKMKKEKILHILPTNSFSGAENVVCTIIENNKKYDMYYCCPRGPIEEILKMRKIKYIPLKRMTPHNIKKVCKENNISILHAHDYKASFCAALSGFKGKIISHLHNNPPFMKKWNIYTIIYSIISKKFDTVVFVSKEVFNEAIFKKWTINKYFIINNVVDKDLVIEQAKKEFDKKYDLAFIGRITEQKNPLLFIDVVKKLIEKKQNINAVMIGSGDMEKECISLIKKYHIEENIDVLGYQSNPFCVLNNTKIVIMPSVFEGFGLTAIESMCLNKPVLNSGVGGLSSIYSNNPEFICNTVDDYVKVCYSLLNDQKRYDVFQRNAKKILDIYTDINRWKKSIDKLYGGDDK